MTPICASATPSHIPSLVHVSHAKKKSGFHGRNICTTAQRFCPPRRSLTLSPTEHVSPTGLSSTSQLRTLGMLSKLILSVFLGTPEAGPGTLLGHPIRFINVTKDLPPGATPKWTDSDVPPMTSSTSTFERGSRLNAGPTAGVLVGRVAAFSIICAAIFYLRRRRPRAQSLASMGDDVHHPQMETSWKSPSDRTQVDSSSLTETLSAMTKPYKSKTSAPSDYV
jgi:hypothetical protein